MTLITVVIPTVFGREDFLTRCVRGYTERSRPYDLELIILRDRETCGIAWQEGADMFSGDYLHFSADDVVPGYGWAEPMIACCDDEKIPVSLTVSAEPECLDADSMPLPGNPIPTHGDRGGAFYFEREPSGPDVIPDGYVLQPPSINYHAGRGLVPWMPEYPSAPFCSRAQWELLGPMIPTLYSTDKWFGWRAFGAGIPCVVRHGPVFYHYAANAGRGSREHGWLHWDVIDFDMNIAWPEYVLGMRDPRERHPDRLTPRGRQMVRAWRMANTPPPYPWDLEPDPVFH